MIKIPGLESYFGGKGGSGTYQKIINQIRPHKTFIVPFLGNCGVLRHIRPADNVICTDANKDVVKKWKQAKLPFNIKYGNAFKLLSDHLNKNDDGSRTVIYLDPPYPKYSRKSSRNRYNVEMTIEEHQELLKLIKQLKCDVLISTYENDLYKQELKDWRLIKFSSMTHSGTATEYLYMNYPEPTELHDYKYLGDDFRKREQVRKKRKRHLDKLLSLPILERNALIHDIMNHEKLNTR